MAALSAIDSASPDSPTNHAASSSAASAETAPADDGREPSSAKEAWLVARLVRQEKVASYVAWGAPALAALLIMVALVWLVLLPVPQEPFSRAVYVDENALQPGHLRVRWDQEQVHISDRYSDRLLALAQQGDETARIGFLVHELASFGLEVHTQAYSFTLPGGTHINGTNVYGRARMPRIDGREAMILAASWRSRWRERPTTGASLPYVPDDGTLRAINIRGISLSLAMAQHMLAQPHWSKDLLVVFSDGYLDGMHAWANGWFGRPQVNLEAEPVHGAGAQVWNALALDYPSDSFSSMSLLHEGRDGQLPNLDTLNTFSTVVKQTLITPPLGLHGATFEQTRYETPGAEAWAPWLPTAWLERHWLGRGGVQAYLAGWRALLSQWRLQLAGHPSGVHGVLLPFHVDAVTIFAEPAPGPYGFLQLGKALEGTLISFSNLLERLHHSQFFYLLLSPWRFVQISVSILVPLLLGAALTVSGLVLWADLARARDAARDALRRVSMPGPWLAAPTLRELVDQGSAEAVSSFRAAGRPIVPALVGIAFAHGAALVYMALVLRSPIQCTATGLWDCPSFAASAVWTAVAPLLMAVCLARGSQRRALAQCLHAFSLLHAGMLVSVLATTNWAQATVMALLVCGTLYPLSPRRRWRLTYVGHALWLLVATPPVLTLVLTRWPRAWPLAPSVPHVYSLALWDWHVLRTHALDVLGLGYLPVLLQGATAAWLYAIA
ncbi:dolichyl-P-Man:Man5GlcNAc2-PP-dolichol alpha-1,3-mannosyltransferase [Malassezia nana]|uniref:Dolichyl-P-Man:Man5GlcNAc2-PP-dolichol alpha-1,3-mannosyltransferase n=1 Tax=Malassezia nana TaxID=180528 RepID=A0AAF0ET71_9BASI|nr:dolichyl-P-Man:Man5GlcNAc2-PP-dolichol alpha-1,3-mannosyltransferase [Malassezia nana]